MGQGSDGAFPPFPERLSTTAVPTLPACLPLMVRLGLMLFLTYCVQFSFVGYLYSLRWVLLIPLEGPWQVIKQPKAVTSCES